VKKNFKRINKKIFLVYLKWEIIGRFVMEKIKQLIFNIPKSKNGIARIKNI
jgi:hypothetical protein